MSSYRDFLDAPFAGLYHYSSSERDLSNCRTRDEFMAHYQFVVEQVARVTMPGRLSAVHTADVPVGGGVLFDFPGEVIRLHERCGMRYIGKHMVWKEPLAVRTRTMAKGLAHLQIVDDSAQCDMAGADTLLLFKKPGSNRVPITYPHGFLRYVGARQVPPELLQYRDYAGHQTENSYSHWIWRQYASSFWDDVRIDRVLPFRDSREADDEKHVHPLQLDVIERIIELRSNHGEMVLTPFMGVGSEVYGAVLNGRKGIGIELKASYYKQAVLNLRACATDRARESEQGSLLERGETSAAEMFDEIRSPKIANRNTWKTKAKA